jgi:hypothetical protein
MKRRPSLRILLSASLLVLSLVLAGAAQAAETEGPYTNPVFIAAVELPFVVSAAVAHKALAANGLSDPVHEWYGCQTNVEIPSTVGDAEDDFLVTYIFPDPVDPAGAARFGDDSDDR